MSNDMSIGENIRFYRKKNGMSQKELAIRIGKSYSAIQKYELNITIPPLSVIDVIAEALHVDRFDIIGWNEVVLDSLEEKKSSVSEETEEKDIISMEKSNRLYDALVAAGLIVDDDLAAEDIHFLGHICDLIGDWFARKHRQ